MANVHKLQITSNWEENMFFGAFWGRPSCMKPPNLYIFPQWKLCLHLYLFDIITNTTLSDYIVVAQILSVMITLFLPTISSSRPSRSFKNRQILTFFGLFSSFQYSPVNKNFPMTVFELWSSRIEATALPTNPQPLPNYFVPITLCDL